MIRIDAYPTHELNGVKYRCGRVLPFGASFTGGGGINFSIFSRGAVSCELLLYHYGEPEPFLVIPFPEEFRLGSVFTMTVYDLNYDKLEYGYRYLREMPRKIVAKGECTVSTEHDPMMELR